MSGIERKPIRSMQFKNLSFAFDGKMQIFENITSDLPQGRAVWVSAPGGRGKSTFLKILNGLISPTSGSYFINGEDVTQMSFEDFLPYRMNMGYGFDMGGLLNNKTLAENLVLPLLYHKIMPQDEAIAHVSQITEFFGMQDFCDKRPFAVSGSLRKLTCVLRAFVHSPQVVLLDDPLTGLKRDHLNDFYHFVEERYAKHELRQVFFTTESTEFAQKLRAEELMISLDWFTQKSVA
jgi:ABC-type transporter Mla maintaining outer membrane lipid asymmetry ATPase subunit MlaF